MKKDPFLFLIFLILFSCSKDSNLQVKEDTKSSFKSTYKIPVVVHITNTANNFVSDTQIKKFINSINLDYNAMNESLKNVSAHFTDRVGNASIEFVLAKKDPIGQSTTGITRTVTPFTNIRNSPNETPDYVRLIEYLKSEVGNWDGDKYLNIIFCVPPSETYGLVLTDSKIKDQWGYTEMPPFDNFELAEGSLDKSSMLTGVIINYNTLLNNFNKATSTATHEIGHWLGLRHTFGLGYSGFPVGEEFTEYFENFINSNGGPVNTNSIYDQADDRIEDTPWTNIKSDNLELVQFGEIINVENFMTYTINLEKKMFTKGQVEAMHNTLNNNKGGRQNLWSETNLIHTGLLE